MRLSFVTTLVELSIPISIGVQTLIGVVLAIVMQSVGEGLMVPHFHIGIELFHFAHEHQCCQPVRHPFGGDNSMNNALIEFL